MKFKEILTELLMTFSTKKSLFSSKKIERFFSFSIAMAMIVVYYALRVSCFECVERFTTTDVILLSGVVFGYAGYTMAKTEKAKIDEQKSDNDTTT